MSRKKDQSVEVGVQDDAGSAPAPKKSRKAKLPIQLEIPDASASAPSAGAIESEQPASASVDVEPQATTEAAATPDSEPRITPIESESSEAADGEPRDGPVDAPEAGESPDGPVETEINIGLLEALLMSTHHPLTAGKLAEYLELKSTKPVKQAVRALNEQYESSKRAFRVEQVAGGYQILTLPDYGETLKAVYQKEIDAKLTKAAMETLAIIAYKQPILRADIEAIRGVASGETIRSLMEKHLVKIDGRAEIPGRPILYGTTKRFLEVFGLNNIKELPEGEKK